MHVPENLSLHVLALIKRRAIVERTINDKNADMDYHTHYLHQERELEATPSGKSCVSKILKFLTMAATGAPPSSGQLEAAGASSSGCY